jgi:O-antigen ligase/polysaccharide polymerase Wzy-like membrane protein
MRKQPLAASNLDNTVDGLLSARTRHDTILFIILLLTLFSLTPFLTLWGLSAGIAVIIGLLVVPPLVFALLRWPMLGLYLIATCAFIVELDPLQVPVGTDKLYVFYWPPQMAGLPERPFGMLMLLVLFVWVFQRLVKRWPLLQGGALIGPFTLYMLCVVGAMINGLAHGGVFNTIILEFRPFWYTFLSYILAYNFMTRKSDVRNFFWLAIVSAGIKGLQGIYVFLLVYHGNLAANDTVMSHEESFFYASLLLLLIIFRLHYRYRPQLIACLCVAPPVVIALIANQRRTDYLALLLAIGFAWVMIFQLKPKARRALVTGMIICGSLSVTYVLVGASIPGSIGSPARSIIGVFDPSKGDSRAANSNLYRDYENYDLKYTAKQYPLLGLGFGKEYLQPKPLTSVFPQIAAIDSIYNIVPHNTIYWVWADMGPIGFFALWFLLSSIIVRGCFIARQLKDPYLQVVAIFIVGVTVMEVAVAFADYQLYAYRNVVDLGLLAGILVKLPILDKEEEGKLTNEYIDGVSVPS